MERPPRSGGRLAALALAQIVAWGVLYYARNRFITAGIFVAGIAAGAIRGALTLVQASAVADRWGTGFYGKLNGALAAPVTAVSALAPGVAALVAEALGSYAWMAVVMAVLCTLGGVLAVRR
jgi:hypothetical protein